MLLCLALIAIPAIDVLRRKNFNTFWYLHHFFFLYFALFSIHGAFCLLKRAEPPYCSKGAVFWKYYLVSGVIYLLERISREYRGSRGNTGTINKVVLHPSHVIELQIKKNLLERSKPGQYIFINCPAVSLNEWHPFTLTSAPEEDFYSVHIRVVGDWTKSLTSVLGIDDLNIKLPQNNTQLLSGARASKYTNHENARKSRFISLKNVVLPELMIDGPFGSASEDAFKHEVVMLFGSGIGVTPFASVLKSMWYRFNLPGHRQRLKKVYFIWTQKDASSFEWFQDLLQAIEDEEEYTDLDSSASSFSGEFSNVSFDNVSRRGKFIDMRIHITAKFTSDQIQNLVLNDSEGHKDAITNLRTPTYFGRPNLEKIFKEVATNHPGADVGVFFCGPTSMGLDIKSCSNKFTSKSTTGTRFTYKHENF
ncbi:hypothetical protein BB559_005000 [Furculomyces boomerangus]|uniref:FAD-binding FR-type domain-containing protein n=2 Tax=Harpellales TaxID=61421 RepID=A0A2T9YBG7_9FUNG|nr:hypothetical protein BB559_005000 [Furculomyces boomerangus]